MIFKGSLVLQLLLAIAFLGFGWQADQAMDKSGMGDAFEWHRLSVLSGAAFYGLAGVWLATIAFSVVSAKFRSSLAQAAIGMPPLLLITGWCLSFLV